MMGFYGEGEIIKISNADNGNVVLTIKDTQIPFASTNGHQMGERDYIWSMISRTPQEGAYYKNVFFKGARIWVTGKLNQKKNTNEENHECIRNIVFKIDRIYLFNNGDPKKRKIRERYNSKVVGEETPDIMDTFKNDF